MASQPEFLRPTPRDYIYNERIHKPLLEKLVGTVEGEMHFLDDYQISELKENPFYFGQQDHRRNAAETNDGRSFTINTFTPKSREIAKHIGNVLGARISLPSSFFMVEEPTIFDVVFEMVHLKQETDRRYAYPGNVGRANLQAELYAIAAFWSLNPNGTFFDYVRARHTTPGIHSDTSDNEIKRTVFLERARICKKHPELTSQQDLFKGFYETVGRLGLKPPVLETQTSQSSETQASLSGRSETVASANISASKPGRVINRQLMREIELKLLGEPHASDRRTNWFETPGPLPDE